MLSDDDALVSTPSKPSPRKRHGTTPISCSAAWLVTATAAFQDRQNTMECPAVLRDVAWCRWRSLSGRCFYSAVVRHASERFRVFEAVADLIHNRTGRFFWTNGVEFSAWPMTVPSRGRSCSSTPLTILERTKKSWGSNMGLVNPGKEQIQAFIDDIDHERRHAPLRISRPAT